MENANGGTIAVTNTCGFFSGNVDAPGTKFLAAGGDLNAIAAGSFQVQVGRTDLFGSADAVIGGNIVEYDFTPMVMSTPEPSGLALVAIGFLGLIPMQRRSRLLRANVSVPIRKGQDDFPTPSELSGT